MAYGINLLKREDKESDWKVSGTALINVGPRSVELRAIMQFLAQAWVAENRKFEIKYQREG